PEVYETGSQFDEQLKIVAKYIKEGKVVAVKASDFADWYIGKYPGVSPAHIYKAADFLGSGKKVVWYQSTEYRVGALEEEGNFKIFDYRKYQSDYREPYYFVPNRSSSLNINLPSLVDSISAPDEKVFYEGKDLSYDYKFQALSASASRQLKSKKFVAVYIIIPVLLTLFVYIRVSRRKAAAVLAFWLLGSSYWYNQNLIEYQVAHDEVSALTKLRDMESGEVLVANSECLQCANYSDLPFAAFYNKRGYVQTLSDKKIKYAGKELKDVALEDAKNFLAETGVDYIYLVRIGDYEELLPHSPGDWGVELVYDNANAQIWKKIK
ncbi:MAG: hypothetical protein US96_C0035G0017, partial [Candidatus Woesebacteria bacterium GW2011_GWB1_38_5b]